MDASVVIRTKNESKFIGETLKRVQGQDFSDDHEIIIVDSGSTDSTLDIIKEYDVRLVEIPQQEFTYGRSLNIGASSAKGRFIVNLSAHALPKDGKWLKSLIAGFEEPDVAGIYGRQFSDGHLNPFEALQHDRFFGQGPAKFSRANKKGLRHIHFSNSNCAIRKDVWQRFRFNEHVHYAEDMLWQREVIDAGLSILYTPEAAVYHTHPVSAYKAYRDSRECAYSLGLMMRTAQSVSMVVYDLAVFMGSVPNAILRNLMYIWRNNYREHLMSAPVFVLSAWLGWLTGRIKYRLKR